MKSAITRAMLAMLPLLAMTPQAGAQMQGVTKTEVVVGTLSDLSGPLAAYGKGLRDGATLRFDEVNEQGGVHGRKIRFLVEDTGYDPKRAVLAAQKLVVQDKIFVMVASLGSAPTNAALPVLRQSQVMNFFPMTLARDMYEPVDKLKFAFISSYVEQMTRSVPRLVREKNATRPCAMIQDDDFGLEVLRGAEAGLKLVGKEVVERASYKRGATDFSSQMARLKQANCDFVVLGTVIRETVGAIAEARKIGFEPTFLASVAAYTDLIPKLGGKAMDGLYATMTATFPYEDDASQPVRFWSNKFKTKFGAAPNIFSAYGYIIADRLVSALQRTGPNLSTDTLAKALEGMVMPADMFGMPELRFSPTSHLGSGEARLSQLQDGRWRVVLDYAQMR